MKKIIIIITGVILLLMIVFVGAGYLIFFTKGKDDVASFGNGRFDIIRDSSPKRYFFYDSKAMCFLESDIYAYWSFDNKIYIYGGDGYTVVEFTEGSVKQYREKFDQKKSEIYSSERLEKIYTDKNLKYLALRSYDDLCQKEKYYFEIMKNKYQNKKDLDENSPNIWIKTWR